MVKGLLIKSELRLIKGSLNRFLAILVITILGIAFFAGLRTTAPFMQIGANAYLEQNNMMDYHLVSTWGFDEQDVKSIQSVPGIKDMQAGYSYVVLSELERQTLSINIISLKDNQSVNKLDVTAGRLPQNASECIVDPKYIEYSHKAIGDVLEITTADKKDLSDVVSSSAYTIVGIANSPLYLSNERGSASTANGWIDAYLFIPESNFTLSYFTDIYLVADKAADISRFSEQYAPQRAGLQSSLEAKADVREQQRFASENKKALAELVDARKDLVDGYKKLNDARDKIADGASKLAKGEADYNQGKKDLSAGQKELDKQKKAVSARFAKEQKKLSAGLKQWRAGKARYDKGKAAANNQAAQAAAQFAAALVALDSTSPLYLYQREAIDAQKATADAKIAAAYTQLKKSKAQLDASKKQLDAGSKKLNVARTSANAKIAKAEKKLVYARTELAQAKLDLEVARAKLALADAKFNTKERDALKELSAAEQDIAEGEANIAELELPKWYIFGLADNLGFKGFVDDAQRIDIISLVIPIIFFLVSILVCMTSMTRLVDQERTIIATFKALGYRNSSIAARYLAYAASASLIGCAIGVLIGFNLFPQVIMNAYQNMYRIPMPPTYYDSAYIVLSSIVALAAATIPAYLVCRVTLKEAPAEAMRPAAPKPGKRILFERIPIIWSRISFLHKVTIRNLFRYKKRMLMTIFGVAGCTALLFVGFGINDSLITIKPKQYENIWLDDAVVDFDAEATKPQLDTLHKALLGSPEVEDFTYRHLEVGKVFETNTLLVVPQDNAKMDSFTKLRERVSQKPLALNGEGAIISERLSVLHELRVGDSIDVKDTDDRVVSIKISGIMENYLYHYIFLDKAYYESVFGSAPQPNQVLCNFYESPQAEDQQNAFTQEMRKLETVNSVTISQVQASMFDKMLDALKYVVVVIIISAAALIFVVLFSLSTINLEERRRELASIKVLGFKDFELALYTYREGIILTAIGILLGLGLGVLLQRYIITTIELNVVMQSRDLLWQSFAYSIGLTVIFAFIVNAVMYHFIKDINMVESLKSIE